MDNRSAWKQTLSFERKKWGKSKVICWYFACWNRSVNCNVPKYIDDQFCYYSAAAGHTLASVGFPFIRVTILTLFDLVDSPLTILTKWVFWCNEVSYSSPNRLSNCNICASNPPLAEGQYVRHLKGALRTYVFMLLSIKQYWFYPVLK